MNGNLDVTMDIKEVTLVPEEHLSMDEAVKRAEELGYSIKRIDKNNRRIVINHGK